jgi:hypothetical protein
MPADPPISPPPPENRPPLAPEEANVNNALHLQPLGSESVTSTPIASTAMGSLGNLDTFLQSLTQGLHHSPK